MTSSAAGRILVVDNHDSFVHTLMGYVIELGATVEMIEADAVTEAEASALLAGYDGVLLSPGPGAPKDAGASLAVARAATASGIPLLGVCLGHQVIAEAFGAVVAQAPELVHGMTSEIIHDDNALWEGLASPFTATRYHSLAVVASSLPDDVVVTATTPSGVVMGLSHRTKPVWGVQFHPESVLTEGGYRLLGNWLELTGLVGAAARGAALSPHRSV